MMTLVCGEGKVGQQEIRIVEKDKKPTLRLKEAQGRGSS
jgi:hypothetical protein